MKTALWNKHKGDYKSTSPSPTRELVNPFISCTGPPGPKLHPVMNKASVPEGGTWVSTEPQSLFYLIILLEGGGEGWEFFAKSDFEKEKEKEVLTRGQNGHKVRLNVLAGTRSKLWLTTWLMAVTFTVTRRQLSPHHLHHSHPLRLLRLILSAQMQINP